MVPKKSKLGEWDIIGLQIVGKKYKNVTLILKKLFLNWHVNEAFCDFNNKQYIDSLSI